jgi:DNA-binding MarR family transcriptional regulator
MTSSLCGLAIRKTPRSAEFFGYALMAARPDVKSPEWDLEHRIFYRFSLLVGRHVRYFSTHKIKRYGLSTQSWLILTVIGRFAPISPSELADHTSVRRDRISRILDLLLKQDLIARHLSSSDRRRLILTLTPKGRKVCDKLEIVARQIDLEVLRRLTKLQRKALSDILSTIEMEFDAVLKNL